MKKIDEFKSFVREKPSLINYVKNNEMTWQKFYEMWDLYGSDNEIWSKYSQYVESKPSTSSTISDFMGVLKKLDSETIRQGVVSLQKGIGVVQDLIKKETPSTPEVVNEPYRPRPMFRRFED